MKLPEERQKFIELIDKGVSITKACKILNIHRSTFYEWRNNDANFLRSFMKSKSYFIDQVDDAAESWYHKWVFEGDRRAVNKWLDTKHHTYLKKPMNILLYKEGEIEKSSINMDKEELFNFLRALEHFGHRALFDSQDDETKTEYKKWYKKRQPHNSYDEESLDSR